MTHPLYMVANNQHLNFEFKITKRVEKENWLELETIAIDYFCKVKNSMYYTILSFYNLQWYE